MMVKGEVKVKVGARARAGAHQLEHGEPVEGRVRLRLRLRSRLRVRADQLEHGKPVADLLAVLPQELAW